MRTSHVLFKLLRVASPNKGKVLFAALCSMLNKICDILPEVFIGIAIDVIVNQENSLVAAWGIVNPIHQLYAIGFLTALFLTLESIFEYLYSITWRSLSEDIQHTLRLKIYAKVQDLDLAYFEDKTIGGLLTIFQDDIRLLEEFLNIGPNQIIQLITNIIVMGLIFFYLSPTLALISLVPIPFIVGVAYYFQQRLAHFYALIRKSTSNLAAHTAYRLEGITTIKSYTTEDYELNLFKQTSKRYKKATHNADQTSAQYIPCIRLAITIGFTLSLVVGGIYTLQGQIPLNWYATLVFLMQKFLWPFALLTSITTAYQESNSSARRILTILNHPQYILDGAERLQPKDITGSLFFKNISFTYSNGVQIFDKINFEIPAKKTVAFVGPTGSGKSSIIKLLLRFYSPESGLILLDTHDIKKLSLHDLRASIALVSQDVYLVDGTIADNIAYGSFEASRAAIIEASKLAQAHDFIMELPEGYDTKVHEHGKNLSGGQRQRLSIARAILKKSPILVFDEATSAIDNETEAAIQQALVKIKANHTIIIIAHRLSTVRNADIIFVLEKGVIVESGDHETLLKENGAYARLWKAQ